MSKTVAGLRYSESHEWVSIEGSIATIGITDFAQHALGNLSYVDMPEVDDEVTKGEEFGAVESVKAASDLYSPVSGKVIEINTELEDAPERLNVDPYANWIIKVEMSNPSELDDLMDEYRASYDFATDNIETVRYQAREEIAIKKMMDSEGCSAFSNTFQDLYGMEQLPGLASQHLMALGYGYGGEGDWKVSAMMSIMKRMGKDENGESAFMEDYTYNLVPGAKYSLGAHMLEVCPTIASGRPRIEVHPLGIGDRKDPARLVFEGKEGDAIVVSLIDMGGRLRLICQDIKCVKPILPMPNLPVARVMWQAYPDLETGLECWITAGGAHHTVLSYDVSAEQMKDFANMMGIEFVHITKETTVESLEKELFLNDIAWKLR